MKDKPTETDAALTAVTPIDGRYRARTRSLEAYFSESALIRYRVRVEIEWYLSLAGQPAVSSFKPIPAAIAKKLRAVYEDFTLDDARRVKELDALAGGGPLATAKRPSTRRAAPTKPRKA